MENTLIHKVIPITTILLGFLTSLPAISAGSLLGAEKYEIDKFANNNDVATFTQKAVPSFMGAGDRYLAFWSKPNITDQGNYLHISAKFIPTYGMDAVTKSYRSYCNDMNGEFVSLEDNEHNAMCMSKDQLRAAFIYEVERVDQNVHLTLYSPKDEGFFSEDFLKQASDAGYKTPKMIEAENKEKNRKLSLLTRESLLKIGSKACTFSHENPKNIVRGYVEAIVSNKIKIALDGDMTKTTWVNPEEWFECSIL